MKENVDLVSNRSHPVPIADETFDPHLDPRRRTQDAECKTQDAKGRIPDAELIIQDAGFGTQDTTRQLRPPLLRSHRPQPVKGMQTPHRSSAPTAASCRCGASKQGWGSLFAFFLLAGLLFASACSKDEKPDPTPPGPQPDGKRHTVMVYLTGTSLLRFYKQNIEGMCNAMNERMLSRNRILICYQPADRTSAVMQEVCYDASAGKADLCDVKTYPSFEAADPDCVAGMFADMQSMAPADSYGIIIGCHGKAWVPAYSGVLRIPGKQDFEEYWKPAEGALPTRSFGDSGHELDISALAAILEGMEKRAQYLIFDACFMANIETLYDLRNSADYIVASPCEVMGIGFPYSQITPALLSDADVADKMRQTCLNFYDYYRTQTGYNRSGCISLTVASELDGLAEVMRRIHTAPKRSFDVASLQIYEALSSPLLFDLGHYVVSFCTDAVLLDEFDAQMARAFPEDCRLHTDTFYSAYNQQMNPVNFYTGVSVSEPSSQYTAENQQTTWYRATH